MPVRKIVTYGHPVLDKAAEPVSEIDDEIRDARPRHGPDHARRPGNRPGRPPGQRQPRVITVDLSVGENPDELHHPRQPGDRRDGGRRCLPRKAASPFPGIHEKVQPAGQGQGPGARPRGQGKEIIDAAGTLARVFCHEIDHINGRLFIENLTPLEKSPGQKEAQEAPGRRLTRNEDRFLRQPRGRSPLPRTAARSRPRDRAGRHPARQAGRTRERADLRPSRQRGGPPAAGSPSCSRTRSEKTPPSSKRSAKRLPDIIVVVAYGQIIPAPIIDLPR